MSTDNPAPSPKAAASAYPAIASMPGKEDLYHRLFELMPGSLVLMDARGYILDTNPAFCRQIGYPRELLLGAHISRFSRETIEGIDQNIGRMMAGEVLEHQVTNIQADGSLRYYDLREAAIALPDGSRGILALANDVTDRLRAEHHKLELERQLLHTDKLKSLGILAGGIAHEYNNLLAAIIGNLDLTIMDLDAKSPLQNNLREAAFAALRASNLTQQMLAYSGRGRFVISPIDLSALIGGMEELLKASISKKASLKLNLASDLPTIPGDDPQLQQVLMNLVTNASEALGERPGLITLTTRLRDCDEDYLSKSFITDKFAAGSYVELEVRDSGSGMDEATREKLFDPFFTTKFTGRGLGMSVVMGVVRGHKGAIMVSSQPGCGTAVTILFPVLGKPANPVAAPTPPAANSPALAPPLTGTVLVIEDEATIRLLIERILKRLGLQVLTAADGMEGLAIFQERANEISFVILDFTMPKLDGIKTLAELRKVQPDVKAVLTSGYNVENINQSYAQEGFAAFLRKPFHVETLIQVARELCAKA
jgi:two-component system cell cycle sensor histidine kinase/response regulator CckA